MDINEILTRGVENIIPSKDKLAKLLKSGKKLNIYHGIDPTATRIHLGHAFSLRKIQALSEMGHNVTFLIGDFTALIGDTSDKDKERPVLTYEQIKQNFKTYKKQAEKILDFSKVKVRHNSEWLKELNFTEVVKLCQHFSVGDFVSREMIRKRMDAGSRVALHEVLYPVMQGYDSYFLDTDIQIGGTDQTFNMQAGRTLQKDLRSKESFVLATGFLEGTDGRKMSKSWGNAIWLDDEPEDMFGKIMSVRDELIESYATLGTNMSMTEIKKLKQRLSKGENPMSVKLDLAEHIVSELHSQKAAQKAKEDFEKKFQKKSTDVYQDFKITKRDLLGHVVSRAAQVSMSQAKRWIGDGAVDIDGVPASDPRMILKNGQNIKIGKKIFIKVQSK